MKDYNYIDLFSGIMGFSYGAYMAGMKFKNHFYSELDPYCLELAKLRFPDLIPLGDITKIDLEELKLKYGDNWIITGGFPCQDISVAGRGKGLIDNEGNKTRSGLWFTYWKVIRELRPRFVIIENVGMLVNRGLDTVLSNLAEIGYDAEWQDIRAEDMGAPHKRERIWIVAYPRDNEYSTLKGQERKTDEVPESNRETRFSGESNRTANDSKVLADPSNIRCKHNSEKNVHKEYKFGMVGNNRFMGQSQSKQNIFKMENFKKFKGNNKKSNWTVKPPVGRLVDGLSGRVDRLKGLGNAIVPQIAELLFRQIKPYL